MQKENSGKYDFKVIVEKHQEKVRNTCFKYLHSFEDADDIAQEVFMQIYKSLNSFREEAQISTWIYRIAINKSLDLLRSRKRKKRLAQVISIFGFSDEENEMEIQSEENLQQNYEESERAVQLNKAIETLPENQKTALLLSKYQSMSNKEIAEIMETSVSAVEALLNRSKNNLRKKLFNFYENQIS